MHMGACAAASAVAGQGKQGVSQQQAAQQAKKQLAQQQHEFQQATHQGEKRAHISHNCVRSSKQRSKARRLRGLRRSRQLLRMSMPGWQPLVELCNRERSVKETAKSLGTDVNAKLAAVAEALSAR